MRVPWRGVAAGTALALGAAVYALRAFGPVYEVARGTPVRHDDFFYTVTRVERTPADAVNDRYTVAVLVDNRAMRTGYEWRDSIAYVRDGRGPRLAPLSDAVRHVAAGSQKTVELQFDVPKQARRPLLRFWDGVYMGDVFNAVDYAKAGVRLK